MIMEIEKIVCYYKSNIMPGCSTLFQGKLMINSWYSPYAAVFARLDRLQKYIFLSFASAPYMPLGLSASVGQVIWAHFWTVAQPRLSGRCGIRKVVFFYSSALSLSVRFTKAMTYFLYKAWMPIDLWFRFVSDYWNALGFQFGDTHYSVLNPSITCLDS